MKQRNGIRLFISFGKDRASIDVQDCDSVKSLKEIVRETFSIGPDEGPAGLEGQHNKKLTLNCAGADLKDRWLLTDIGIQNGSNVRAYLKEEEKPVLYIYEAYNGKTVPILDKIHVPSLSVADLRGIVSRKTGFPVGIFRLSSHYGVEMYDCHTLEAYSMDMGDVVRLDIWDGWNELLDAITQGFISQVMTKLSSDEIVAWYQMKVALYMAAHIGHVDLAVSLLRQGLRADELVGEHPSRQWCDGSEVHIDSFKAPVHESAEAGQLGVLRSFVHNNVCNVLAKDGIGLTPLNIALRRKQKPCASFLLTKQWSKVNYTKKTAIPLSIFVKMKRWADRSKDHVLLVQGQFKSSVKAPRRQHAQGALVGQGVQVDGFTESKMTSRSMDETRQEEELEQKPKRQFESEQLSDIDPESYFKTVNIFQGNKLPRLSKTGKMLFHASSQERCFRPAWDRCSEDSGEGGDRFRPGSSNTSVADKVRLPIIKEKSTGRHGRSSKQDSVEKRDGAKGYAHKRKIAFAPRGKAALDRMPEQGRGKSPSPTRRPYHLPRPKSPNHRLQKGEPLSTTRSVASPTKTHKSTSLPSLPHSEGRPWVKVSDDDPGISTLRTYEGYRGLGQREYASKCLDVACSFSDKPWLQQVRQAILIARQGVRKTVSGEPHLFTSDMQGPQSSRLTAFSVDTLDDRNKDVYSTA